MRIKFYIERRNNESWRDLSRLLCHWLEEKTELTRFGIVETDTIRSEKSDVELFGSDLKSEYSKYVPLLEEWTQDQKRLYGLAKNGEVKLTNNEVVKLAPDSETKLPEWAKM